MSIRNEHGDAAPYRPLGELIYFLLANSTRELRECMWGQLRNTAYTGLVAALGAAKRAGNQEIMSELNEQLPILQPNVHSPL